MSYRLQWRSWPPADHPWQRLWSVWGCVCWGPSPAVWLSEGSHTSQWMWIFPLPDWKKTKRHLLQQLTDSKKRVILSQQSSKTQGAFHWCSPVCVHKPAQRVPSTQGWGHQLNSWRCPHRRGWACQEKHVTCKTLSMIWCEDQAPASCCQI